MKPVMIPFGHNWNNKLDCRFFTTFRLHNPQKYIINAPCEIYLKGHLYKRGKIVEVKKMKLDQVGPWTAGLDTGYSVEEFKKLVRTMYKNKVKSPDEAWYNLVLIETLP